jgi:hypothetical protein
MASQPSSHSSPSPADPIGTLASTKSQSPDKPPVVSKPTTVPTALPTTPKVNEPAEQVTAAIAHGGNTPSPAQTADSKDVRSLVKNPPGKIVDKDVEYYWVGDLKAQVSQLAPGFTPSPYQLFIKVITNVFDLIMTDIGLDERQKADSTLRRIARIFTLEEGKYAPSWARFCAHNLLEMSNLVLT